MKKLSVVALVTMFILQGMNVWGQVPGLPPLGGFNVTPPRPNDIRSIFSIVTLNTPDPYWMKGQFVVTPVINSVNTSVNLKGEPHIPNVTFTLLVGLFDQKQNKFFYYEGKVKADQIMGKRNSVQQPSYNLYFFLSSSVIKAHDFRKQIETFDIQKFNFVLIIDVNGVKQTAQMYNLYQSSYQLQALRDQFTQTALLNLSGINNQLFSSRSLRTLGVNVGPFHVSDEFVFMEVM